MSHPSGDDQPTRSTEPASGIASDADSADERDSERAHGRKDPTMDLRWIVANTTELESLAELNIRWFDHPLPRAGGRAYALALGAFVCGIALTREEIAGIPTGPDLTSIEQYELVLMAITADIPVGCLTAVPVGIVLLGVVIGAQPLLRAVRTEYVLTSETLYVRNRGIRDDTVTQLPLERVVETECRQSLLGRCASYGTVTFTTLEPDFPGVRCRGIANPHHVHQTVLELDATSESPLDRTHEYVRVVPSTGERAADEIVTQLRTLHTLEKESERQSLWTALNPFSAPDPLTFEFTVYSDGTDGPIEFYYTADQHLSTLQNRLNAAYPDTVDIERVGVDLAAKLVAPQLYSYEEFETALEHGTIQCTPGEVNALASVSGDQRTDATADANDPPLGTQLPSIDLGTVPATEDAEGRDRDSLTVDLETPVDTGDGVLARPHPDEVEPYALRWGGSGDSMTPIRKFTDSIGDEDRHTDTSHAPLTALIDDFTTTDHPIIFQSIFQGEPDWTRTARQRKQRISQGRETWLGTVVWYLTAMYGPEQQPREQRPSQGPPQPRSQSDHSSQAPRRTDAPFADDPRLTAIDNEDWARTYTVNARAVTVPTSSTHADAAEITHYLRNLSTVFDSLDGDYYTIEGEILDDAGVLTRNKRTRSRRCFTHILEREIVTGNRLSFSTSEPDLHLDPDELCNLIAVPSTEHLTEEAVKETHASQESRTPLPGLDAAQRRQYITGMELGDDSNSVADEPLCLPPTLQPLHWLLCAATGGGKTQLTLRALLSLSESTPGPNVLIDRKGDSMCIDYLRAHYKQFGDLEDVYYFRVPETLPAISLFDIRPALAAGHDRETAVTEKADHFHELMGMIMDGDQHERAFVANEILTFLIYALFDPVYGDDVFGLDDLVAAATAMQHDRVLPELSPINDDIHDSLASQFDKDDHQFHTTMGAVLNRLNRLKEDRHLHWMLRHTPGRESTEDELFGFYDQDTQFEFGELLDEDVTVLFDLGDLTQDAQRGFGVILLSNLWHVIQHRQRADPDTVVNIILEEAAPFVATELVADQLLPQARSTGVSLGLVMQYPEQVNQWDGGDGAYEELLTDVHTKIIGNISISHRLADSLTHDELSTDEIRNRVNRMANGEWLVHLASPAFGEDRPAPLTMHSLPIVSGHPESDEPLTAEEQTMFEDDILPDVIERTKDRYGLYVPTHEDVMDWSWGETDRDIGSPPTLDTAAIDAGGGDSGAVRDVGSDNEEAAADENDGTGGGVEAASSRDDGGDTRTDDGQETVSNDEPADMSTGAEFFGAGNDTDDCPVRDSELRQRGLSRDDAIFLKRVLDAMNRDVDDYSLLEGMTGLKDELDSLDIRVLIDQDLLEKETVNRRMYYTVLPAGREFLDETITADAGTGDLGEKTPHKVGVELLWQWISEVEEVDRAERYYHHDAETIFDVVGFDADDTLVWVGEVEMASNNVDAVVDDYDKMAAVDAIAVWAFPSRSEAQDMIGRLAAAERLPSQVSGRAARSFSPFQTAVEAFDADGMTTVQTFRKMHEEVEE